LKLKYDVLLASFAFNFNLRRYTKALVAYVFICTTNNPPGKITILGSSIEGDAAGTALSVASFKLTAGSAATVAPIDGSVLQMEIDADGVAKVGHCRLTLSNSR